MSKAKFVKDYKPISDRQLELMDDSQLITTRKILKADLISGRRGPRELILTDYNRVCVRMAEQWERCYAFGCFSVRDEMSDHIATLEAELTACRNQIEVLRAENRSLVFELTGTEPDLPSDSDPELILPFYDPDDDSDSIGDSVLIV